MGQTAVAGSSPAASKAYIENQEFSLAADPVVKYMSREQLDKAIMQSRKAMEKAAKELDFIEAARLRDEMLALQEMLKEVKK